MPHPALGVLVPALNEGAPLAPPETRPLGRAALALADEGVDVVFGDALHARRMTGWRAVVGGWQPARSVPIAAVHDRFPSQARAERFAAVLDALDGLPLGNPTSATRLCRDKLACQRFLETAGVPMPPVESDPTLFAYRLSAWGAGFLKPRFGALGAGIRRVGPTDALPARAPGLVAGVDEPALLQRAVPPPPGLAGCAIRLLCQRLPDGGWHVEDGVARTSDTDPVVNAARGALVAHATTVLNASSRRRCKEQADAVCRAFAALPEGDLVVELGVDLVLDDRGTPHVIEVNGRPRGRLSVLAEQDPATWWSSHVAACARPLRYLASRVA